MRRFDAAFVAFNRWLIGVMMVAMFAMVFTNVVTRYGFGFSLNWAEEISQFIMVWVTFLGAGLALREGRHVSIDVLQERFGETGMRLVRMAIGGLLIAFFAIVMVLGIRFSMFSWDMETMVTQIPRGIPYLAIPIGMAFLIVHFLLSFGRYADRRWEHLTAASAESEVDDPADDDASTAGDVR